ncbi:MAG: alanine--tRNA ligase [Acidimicrobiales bacterium]
MEARKLRASFTDFFSQRGHTVAPSASLIPHDPTLLFTVAGMVPFKPYFLGTETPPYRRATTVQKCVRAGGKHNDLDEIGRTRRHLTFFEMLGNFSFGDYFKADAIPWAWEFSTEVLGFDVDRLWVTVHLSDDEAAEIWIDEVGLAPQRLQRLDEDNYWRMADTGPNGPSSEIFYDKGPAFGHDGGPAEGGHERFLEFWNLVFMQFDARPDGTQEPLPAPSIDTGAGLERILTLVQGVDSVFEIDEMARLVDKAAELSGTPLGRADESDVSLRILAEHARTMTFLIADGVVPSNEERGYVLRRIMRRAIRHAYLLGVEDPVTPALVDEVIDVMGSDYPDIADRHELVRGIVEREEVRFRETLRTGSTLLDESLDAVAEGGTLPGQVAFTLHDTYGFPLEVTEEVARERGLSVDRDAFDTAMSEQRRRARADHDAKTAAGGDVSDYQAILADNGETDFVGRATDTVADARVLAVTADGIVLDRTPFYAESGGQVGDTGTITDGDVTVAVTDCTFVVAGLHLHHTDGPAAGVAVGDTVTASIDTGRRAAIRRNHTATHILHWALREVLGDHVKQQGSEVGPRRLRFDFSHFEAVTPAEIARIEDLSNDEILTNGRVRHFETTMEEATALGAIAFFGDKYGDVVRVLEAGGHSVELCGGTHVGALGDIGPVKIVSEGSIGSNIRRIEAVTGTAPIDLLRADEARIAAAADHLGVPPDDLVAGAQKRAAELKALRDELKVLRRQAAVGRAGELADAAVDGVVVARVDDIDRDGLRDLAVAVRDREGVRAVVLGAAPDGGGVALVAAVLADSGLHASDLLSDAAKAVKGGGGKSPELAVAGGKDPEALDEALDLVRRAAGVA